MEIKNEKTLSSADIIKFWIPLSLMWIVMGFEIPIANAVIARMASPKENLAIFGVVFSISLIIEGPIIQMLSAATALSGSYGNYKKLSRFLLIFVFFLTILHFVCALPPVFNFIGRKILNLDETFIIPARVSFMLMLPWTAAIGYRRMWQGVLIKDGRTYSVTAIMVIRMFATCLVLFVGFYFWNLRGAYIASISLSAGVITGAVAAGIFASSTIKKKKISSHEKTDSNIITMRNLFIFYIPLALTSFVVMANRPILSAGITRSLLPIESLATWPVVYSFFAIFNSFPLSYQEAAITLLGNKKRNSLLRKIVIVIGLTTFLIFLASVSIPAVRFFFFSVLSGLPEELINISFWPMLIMSPALLASPVIAWLRAVKIKSGATKTIALAVMVNLFFVFFGMALLRTFFPKINGITAAAISFTVAYVSEATFLCFSKLLESIIGVKENK